MLDGTEIPVLVWLTAKEETDDAGRVQAVVAVAVDQSAAGRWVFSSPNGGRSWVRSSIQDWEMCARIIKQFFLYVLITVLIDIGTQGKTI